MSQKKHITEYAHSLLGFPKNFAIHFITAIYNLLLLLVKRVIKEREDFRGKLFLWLSPLGYYKSEFRVIANVIFVNPERTLTLLGVSIGLIGFVFFFSEGGGNTDSFVTEPLFRAFAVTSFLVTLIVSPYLSLLLTRGDAKQFAQALSGGGVSTTHLARYTIFEAYRIAEYISRYAGNDFNSADWKFSQSKKIFFSIRQMQESIAILDELKVILADRLKVLPRELSDDFLMFSSSIYVNRHIRYANFKDLNRKLKGTEVLHSQNIIRYADEIKLHLLNLLNSDVDLKFFLLIYQNRSTSAATQHFVKFLEKEKDSVSSFSDLKTVIQIQKAYKTGAVCHRCIAMCITTLVKTQEEFESKGFKLSRKNYVKLIRRAKLNSEIYVDREVRKGHESSRLNILSESIRGWRDDANFEMLRQRKQIKAKFDKYLSLALDEHNNSKNGVFYIFTTSYSRAVRSVLRDLGKLKNSEKVQIVICSADVFEGEYSSRLMYYQIVEEVYGSENGDLQAKAPRIRDRIWRSSFEKFCERINYCTDSVFYVGGCDQFDIGLNDKGCFEELAYKYSNMNYFLNQLDLLAAKKNNTKIEFLIVGGEYKYELEILVKLIKSKKLQSIFKSLLPKRRRSNLSQWKSIKGVKVKIISSDMQKVIKKMYKTL